MNRPAIGRSDGESDARCRVQHVTRVAIVDQPSVACQAIHAVAERIAAAERVLDEIERSFRQPFRDAQSRGIAVGHGRSQPPRFARRRLWDPYVRIFQVASANAFEIENLAGIVAAVFDVGRQQWNHPTKHRAARETRADWGCRGVFRRHPSYRDARWLEMSSTWRDRSP